MSLRCQRRKPITVETIYALASGRGRSAIAVVRVSGPGCDQAISAIAPGAALSERVAAVRTLVDPGTGEKLDRAIVIRFKGPRSFTGEDMVEFQITGSPAVIQGVLGALNALSGFRAAEPGEFARRAFDCGKLDLTEVEGLCDLVEAETAAQRRQALRLAGGALRRECEEVRNAIVRAMASVELQLDFADVDDAELVLAPMVRGLLHDALSRIRNAVSVSESAERLRDGLVVAIAGPTNAGKSTLMNAIVRRDVSIVSAIPGTTRDIIEAALDLDGFPVVVLDTAGLRVVEDPIEAEGVTRTRARVQNADLVLWLSESGNDTPPEEFGGVQMISVETKCDLKPSTFAPNGGSIKWVRISAVTGEGVRELLDEVGRFAAGQLGPACSAVLTRERHRLAFRQAASALERALGHDGIDAEFLAEDLRIAANALERVSGRIGVEDVLDEIFSRLCVGK